MQMIQKLRKMFFYAGLEKEAFQALVPDIHRENRVLLNVFSSIAGIMFFLLFIASMISQGFATVNSSTYLICGFVMVAIKGQGTVLCPRPQGKPYPRQIASSRSAGDLLFSSEQALSRWKMIPVSDGKLLCLGILLKERQRKIKHSVTGCFNDSFPKQSLSVRGKLVVSHIKNSPDGFYAPV